MALYELAALSQQLTAEIVGVGVAVLALTWFALRYWIATTQEPHIKDIPTPNVDRLNSEALEHMDQDPEVQAALSDNEPAPSDLLASLPTEKPATSDAKEKTPKS